jgi:hypothetical protein
MNDEIETVTEMPPSPTAPAVIELPHSGPIPNVEALQEAVVSGTHDEYGTATPWHELSDSQKMDILHRKVDSIASQVAWIGQTFQGVINMVANVGPMDIFKMMRGGK